MWAFTHDFLKKVDLDLKMWTFYAWFSEKSGPRPENVDLLCVIFWKKVDLDLKMWTIYTWLHTFFCVKYLIISIPKCAQNARTAFNFSKSPPPRMASCLRPHELKNVHFFQKKSTFFKKRPHFSKKVHIFQKRSTFFKKRSTFFTLVPPNHFFGATPLLTYNDRVWISILKFSSFWKIYIFKFNRFFSKTLLLY